MDKNIKKSLICNVIIATFVIFATICMYANIEFMGHATLLVSDSVNMLQFYTVQSNMLMGLASILFIIYDMLLIKGKIKAIPKILYLLKLMFTTGVTVTLLTVLFYLAPVTGSNAGTLFMNANLFYHLLVPVLAIITFVFFEKSDAIIVKQTPYCLIPTILYGIYYCLNIFAHTSGGSVPAEYDWYGFARGGVIVMFVVFAVMIVLTYFVILILWNLNKTKKQS